jgi:tetratricopeptide (TPR) repeat protein
MSVWHQLWGNPDEKEIAKEFAALRKGEKLHAKSDRERDYIAALKIFYTNAKLDHKERAASYSVAMEKVYQKYPEDHEAAAFYALSLLAAEPEGDTTFASRKEAGAVLEKLFAIEPNHPGVAHYLIHSYDKPQLAELGLPAARRYAQIAPFAPHAIHMPSHIFARVGDWQASIESNKASIDATRKTAAMHMGGEGHQFHAMDYLIYAYLQTGRESDAAKVIDETKAMSEMHMGGGRDMQSFAMSKFPAMYAIELHRWPDAGALPVVAKSEAGDRAYTYWARAIGNARNGNLAAAKKDLAEIESISKGKGTHNHDYDEDAVQLLYKEANAWVLHGDGKNEDAIASLKKAAEYEDSVGEEQTSMPAREMLADLLLELNRPAEALAEYRGALKSNPKRFDGLYGAGRAAEIAGQAPQAAEFYGLLVKACDGSRSDRPELKKARETLLAQK